jgi:DnaK suppressor protein
MALRKEKLESYRKLLVARRDSVNAGLRVATAQLINEEASYTDSIDQASADIDKSFAMQMKNRELDTLVQIEEALRRIEAGHFGECESCEESISEARIKAFPLTTLCIDCKAELESEERRFPGGNNASN